MMALGKIRVADGLPKAAALYGGFGSRTDETLIDRIDPATGAQTRVKTLGVGQSRLHGGHSGSGWDFLVYRVDGRRRPHDALLNDFGFGDCLLPGRYPTPPSVSWATTENA